MLAWIDLYFGLYVPTLHGRAADLIQITIGCLNER